MPEADATRFLRALFRLTKGQVYLSSLPNQKGGRPGERSVVTRLPDKVERFVERWNRPGRGLFFCVSTLRADAKPTEKGSLRSKDNAFEVAALHADLDFAHLIGIANRQAEVVKVLEALPLPPSAILASGHGVHAYWFLDEAASRAQFEEIEKLLKAFAERLGSDPQVCEIARLMRLPGTTNSKIEDAPKTVRLLKLDGERRYSLQALREMVMQMRGAAFERSRPTPSGGEPENVYERYARIYGIKEPVDVEARLAAMRFHGAGDAGVHATQLAVTASLLAQGMPAGEVVAKVVEATRRIAPPDWDWTQETKDVATLSWSFIDKNPDIKALQRPNEHDPDPPPAQAPNKAGRTIIKTKLWPFLAPEHQPRRQWLYGRHYVRGFVSCTIGPPGAGKSSLALGEAISMASSHNFLGPSIEGPLRVWHHGGEDPMDELSRRLAAICLHYQIRREDIDGRLFVTSGRDMPISIATTLRNGLTLLDAQVVAEIMATIRMNSIDVVQIDPFVSSHTIDENSNQAMGIVARAWADIAETTNCAVELVHHSRKANGEDITVEHGRGASALLGAVRSARTVNRMSEGEAEETGVAGHRNYFRLDIGKANMQPPADNADWWETVSVALGNGDPDNADDQGDMVGVVTPWESPDVFSGVGVHEVRAALDAVRNGGPWRKDIRAVNWVGHPLGAALGISSDTANGKKRLSTIIASWLGSGRLRARREQDEQRRWRVFIEAGKD